MPGINTSMGTSASMKSLLKTERDMLRAMERISSGKRILIYTAGTMKSIIYGDSLGMHVL